MPAIQTPADLLRWDPRIRSTLYTVVVLIGAFLGACQSLGIDKLGSLTVDQALQVYAYFAPLTGAVAVANVGKAPPAADDADVDVEEPTDLSAFEPVGDAEDVFAV